MNPPERLAWPLAILYAGVVTAVAGALVVGGSLLAVVPGMPAGVDRRYGAATVRVLDVLFRPVDALPAVPDRERPSEGPDHPAAE